MVGLYYFLYMYSTCVHACVTILISVNLLYFIHCKTYLSLFLCPGFPSLLSLLNSEYAIIQELALQTMNNCLQDSKWLQFNVSLLYLSLIAHLVQCRESFRKADGLTKLVDFLSNKVHTLSRVNYFLLPSLSYRNGMIFMCWQLMPFHCVCWRKEEWSLYTLLIVFRGYWHVSVNHRYPKWKLMQWVRRGRQGLCRCFSLCLLHVNIFHYLSLFFLRL